MLLHCIQRGSQRNMGYKMQPCFLNLMKCLKRRITVKLFSSSVVLIFALVFNGAEIHCASRHSAQKTFFGPIPMWVVLINFRRFLFPALDANFSQFNFWTLTTKSSPHTKLSDDWYFNLQTGFDISNFSWNSTWPISGLDGSWKEFGWGEEATATTILSGKSSIRGSGVIKSFSHQYHVALPCRGSIIRSYCSKVFTTPVTLPI